MLVRELIRELERFELHYGNKEVVINITTVGDDHFRNGSRTLPIHSTEIKISGRGPKFYLEYKYENK